MEPRSVRFPTGTTVENIRNWHRHRTARYCWRGWPPRWHFSVTNSLGQLGGTLLSRVYLRESYDRPYRVAIDRNCNGLAPLLPEYAESWATAGN